ncbi:MAG: hypothetical protein A2Z58_00355 [Planctomycetes bacterium RIFCSPHIGHO2_12_42_15]|nr:MAG: hypothetical protein A2Z58_00355 [Planctomycetes bacterium RIFCSPHIGHO2_12_42_15]
MVRNKFMEDINIYYLRGLSGVSLKKGMKRMMEESEQRDKMMEKRFISRNIKKQIEKILTENL